MLGLLTGLKTKLFAGAGIVIGILVIFWKVFEAGKTASNVKAMRKTINAVKEQNIINKTVNSSSDDDVIKQLRANGWFDVDKSDS